MDGFDQYLKELDMLVNAKNGKEITERVEESKVLSLERDIASICATIKLVRDGEVYDDFLNELINDGKIDLIKNNPIAIGVTGILNFAIKYKNAELNEYIYENFKNLMKYAEESGIIKFNDIKPYLLNTKFSENIKSGLPIAIRSMAINERVKALQFINRSRHLGSIEDYLDSFLYVPNGKETIGMDKMIYNLQRIKKLDRVKLLEIVKSNSDNLIQSFPEYTIYSIKDFLNSIIKIKEDVLNKSDENQELANSIDLEFSKKFEYVIEKYNFDVDLINAFRKFNIDNHRIKNIQDSILEKLSGADLVKYIQSAKGNEEFDKDWSYEEFARQLLKDNEFASKDVVTQKMLGRLLKEVSEHEKLEIADVEYANSGHFNFNIKIGGYVLKVGKNRNIEDIPNDKGIIKPLLRQDPGIGTENEESNISIELQNAVDTNWYEGLSEQEIREEMYKVYADLRSRGIVWTDVKKENIGRLLKPNKENFEIQTLDEDDNVIELHELKSENYTVGFEGEEPDEILGPGELVVIDTDYIFREGNEKIKKTKTSYYEMFERRYRREQKREARKLKKDGIKTIIKKDGYTRDKIENTESEINEVKRDLVNTNNKDRSIDEK